jgi:hypothetical protein
MVGVRLGSATTLSVPVRTRGATAESRSCGRASRHAPRAPGLLHGMERTLPDPFKFAAGGSPSSPNPDMRELPALLTRKQLGKMFARIRL